MYFGLIFSTDLSSVSLFSAMFQLLSELSVGLWSSVTVFSVLGFPFGYFSWFRLWHFPFCCLYWTYWLLIVALKLFSFMSSIRICWKPASVAVFFSALLPGSTPQTKPWRLCMMLCSSERIYSHFCLESGWGQVSLVACLGLKSFETGFCSLWGLVCFRFGLPP